MARFRLVADEPRQVSILPHGDLLLVNPDELFEVPDEYAGSYECQPVFYDRDEPAPKRAKASANTKEG